MSKWEQDRVAFLFSTQIECGNAFCVAVYLHNNNKPEKSTISIAK